ncbi:embryonic polarity protein dorsal-like isoform X3 [Aricia agestis]|uniref:embryonic polarity protein dorsal-like isoform X3 n=1 Tax=Aricia agestis TaxID=91739 RepID=UPI001C2048A8|nr:embryonic polarity protein dorsal-like isoform X3 [Aricia agestis]
MDIGGDGASPVGQNDSSQSPNLSDVIDAITRTDQNCVELLDAGLEAMPGGFAPMNVQPHVAIVEQPAGKALRFRYECEGRSAGSIPGCNSTPERKTYPTIEIRGHRGPAVIVVSCVTKDEPYKPHPHNLVGRERCENGVCTLKINVTEENPQVSFSNLGIQCVKRKDIGEALNNRERLKVDPFKTGYAHRNQLQSIDLNAVRLCFQVFIPDERTGRIRRSLQPVVSDVIYDKKAMSDLFITKLSHCSASPKGGTEVILLCERITKEDISVVFFERGDGDRIVWEKSAHVMLVHRQYAIVFQTPAYDRSDISYNVQVYLQLVRNSDNARSNALPFEYTPDLNSDASHISRKRQKTLSSVLPQYDNRNFHDQKIKAEPSNTPPHPSHVGSPMDNLIYPPYEQWSAVPGTSQPTYAQNVTWGQNLQQNLQMMPRNMQTLSPNMMSGMDRISPNLGSTNVGLPMNMGHVSPMPGHVSPMAGHVSPMAGHVSPMAGHVSPMAGHASPMAGHVSPMGYAPENPAASTAMGVSPHYTQPTEQLMEMTDTPSLSGLLVGGDIQLNSGDLSGIAAFLEQRQPDLSDSLNRLSTRDLLH